MKGITLALSALLLAGLVGFNCDGESGDDAEVARIRAERERRIRDRHEAHVKAEREARVQSEERLARERHRRDRDRQIAEVKLKQQDRKSSLSATIAIGSACLAAIVILLLARERRVRNTVVAALTHLWERRDAHDA